jgi:hypothetical protein
MEKLILVYYIAIGNMDYRDVDDFMCSITDRFKEDDVIQYFIPIRSEESRIECLNPKLVSEGDYKQAKDVLGRNQKIVDDLVKSFNKSEELLVIELLDFGLKVFNNDNEKFERWLTKENESLGGVKPESLLTNKKDIQDVKNCLNRIEYGNFS